MRFASTAPGLLSAAICGALSREGAIRELRRENRLLEAGRLQAETVMNRLNDELLLAASVQREFLPRRMPSMRGLDSACLFRPTSFVSGDIYDMRRLDEHHVAFFLADAMGHGVPAALMTLFMSGCMRQRDGSDDDESEEPRGVHRSRPAPPRPARVLARLNRELISSRAGPARFATAICGHVHVPSGKLTIASAGHPRPLLMRRGDLSVLDVTGMMLGVLEDYPYEQHTYTLDHEQTLILHSDGLEPAFRHPDSNEGLDVHEGVRAAFSRGESLAESCTRLAGVLDGQKGSLHQIDDVTLLALGIRLRR